MSRRMSCLDCATVVAAFELAALEVDQREPAQSYRVARVSRPRRRRTGPRSRRTSTRARRRSARGCSPRARAPPRSPARCSSRSSKRRRIGSSSATRVAGSPRDRAQLGDRRVVGLEEPSCGSSRVRELEEQLVQVERRQQRSPASGVAAQRAPRSCSVRSSPRPNQSSDERLERNQHARLRRLRAARAPFATSPMRPCFSVQTCRIRLVSRYGYDVEDVAPVHGAPYRPRVPVRSAASLSAQPLFTFTRSLEVAPCRRRAPPSRGAPRCRCA